MGARELANGYSELNDPVEQRARFEEEQAAKEAGDAERGTVDEDYLRALEFGLPPPVDSASAWTAWPCCWPACTASKKSSSSPLSDPKSSESSTKEPHMPAAWGHALVTRISDGTVLDAWFHALGWGEVAAPTERTTEPQHHALRGVTVTAESIVTDTDAAPADAVDVYLRLHLLSHRLAKPRTLNLDGAFGLLANVA